MALTDTHPVARLKTFFAELDPSRPVSLEHVYAEDVVFEDPFHRVLGAKDLTRSIEKMNKNAKRLRFDFHEEWVKEESAVLLWTMTVEVKLGPRRPIVVEGASHLKFAERITFHRDYFDAGALVYEHVPLLGSAVRLLKSRVG